MNMTSGEQYQYEIVVADGVRNGFMVWEVKSMCFEVPIWIAAVDQIVVTRLSL